MDRNGVIRLVVAGGDAESRRSRVDVPLNQRLRESYRAAPARDDDPPDGGAPDASRAGVSAARMAPPVAMAGVRTRRER